jgi:hypothetical protein
MYLVFVDDTLSEDAPLRDVCSVDEGVVTLVLYGQRRAVHHAHKSDPEITTHQRCAEEAKHQQQGDVQPLGARVVQSYKLFHEPGAKPELEGREANRLFSGANRQNDKGGPFSLFSDLKTTGGLARLTGGGCAPRPPPASFAPVMNTSKTP